MHKFIDNIVAFSLKNKFFIFFCTEENGYSFDHSFRTFCDQCNVRRSC